MEILKKNEHRWLILPEAPGSHLAKHMSNSQLTNFSQLLVLMGLWRSSPPAEHTQRPDHVPVDREIETDQAEHHAGSCLSVFLSAFCCVLSAKRLSSFQPCRSESREDVRTTYGTTAAGNDVKPNRYDPSYAVCNERRRYHKQFNA